jgi:hypothetical protein
MKRFMAMQLCPSVLVASEDALGDGVVELRVGQDDCCVAAAQLQHALFERLARDTRHFAPRARAAREGDRRNRRVANDVGNHLYLCEEVEQQALLAAALIEGVSQHHRTGGRVGCRLQHNHIACGNRGRGEAHHLPEREIPRHNRQNHPQRLEGDITFPRLRFHLDGLQHALQVVGEVVQPAGAFLDFGARLLDGLAHLLGDGRGVGFEVIAQRVGDFVQDAGALGVGRLAPAQKRQPRRRQARLDGIPIVRRVLP